MWKWPKVEKVSRGRGSRENRELRNDNAGGGGGIVSENFEMMRFWGRLICQNYEEE